MQAYIKKESLRRLKAAKGHLDHVISLVEKEVYCIDILQQSLAVQSALRSVDSLILKGHLEEHVAEAFKGKDKQSSIDEVVRLFQKMRK
ncbi:MAG: metal-sensitive transcriptional regulator [Nitrososphaerota archaeon]